jgi:hypothetical protein
MASEGWLFIAACLAIVSGVAALRARTVNPELGKNLHALATQFDNLLYSLHQFAKLVHKRLGEQGETVGPIHTAARNLQIAMESAQASFHRSGIKNYTETVLANLGARELISFGAFLAACSGIFQIVALIQVLAEKAPK